MSELKSFKDLFANLNLAGNFTQSGGKFPPQTVVESLEIAVALFLGNLDEREYYRWRCGNRFLATKLCAG
ncbi:hypothetical protein BCD67_02100 [Oscillatoriales cyanobacterium USR001]|nr:hypothetical protein BCD67_02100 [Oscillatoriales cyanobacterium USR001]